MRLNRRPGITVAVTLCAATALVLSACSSSGQSAGGSTTPASAAGASAAESSVAASDVAGASTGGTLIIGMTSADIPSTDTSIAEAQGYEGLRFVGNSLYDGLTKYDLQQGDSPPELTPGLAESWTSDTTGTVWTFKLRPDVKFTDGTAFDADAVIYNLDRYLNKSAPQYSAAAGALAGAHLSGVKAYKKLDPMTVEITTDAPKSGLPIELAVVYMASPTAVEKYGNEEFANNPVGTGPFTLKSLERGQQAVFVPNPDYWGGAPKLDELILKPIPDTAARLAALLAGEVNWIEAPNPDDLATLTADGYQVMMNAYDHMWMWVLDTEKKPLDDARVRQALNYAIDRQSMADILLQGTAEPALQMVARANPAYDPANDMYGYDPEKAKQLLTEAGYPDGFTMSVAYPTSGSGMMQPGPMNEQMQSDLAKVGVKVDLKPYEWGALVTDFVNKKIPGNADALNISYTYQLEGFWDFALASDGIYNQGNYNSPVVDGLIKDATSEPDMAKRAAIYSKVVAQTNLDAPWLYVVNDKNPRVLSPAVHGFVDPKSWFVDLTTISVDQK